MLANLKKNTFGVSNNPTILILHNRIDLSGEDVVKGEVGLPSAKIEGSQIQTPMKHLQQGAEAPISIICSGRLARREAAQTNQGRAQTR